MLLQAGPLSGERGQCCCRLVLCQVRGDSAVAGWSSVK